MSSSESPCRRLRDGAILSSSDLKTRKRSLSSIGFTIFVWHHSRDEIDKEVTLGCVGTMKVIPRLDSRNFCTNRWFATKFSEPWRRATHVIIFYKYVYLDRYHHYSTSPYHIFCNSYIHYDVCDKIIYPFINFNGTKVEFCESINDFILHFTRHVIIYQCRN